MRNGPASEPKPSCARPAWVAAVLALSIGAVYGPSLAVPFIYDDQAAIVENDSITSIWPLIGTPDHPGPLNPRQDLPTTARPLVNLSFAVNYYFGSLDPIGYHVVNVAIHFLSSLLLWAIVRRTLRLPYFAGRYESSAGWLALVVAMLWALHPLVTEAVIYATQRTELAFAFFYLATLYCSLRYWSLLPLHSGEGWGEGALQEYRRPRARATWLVIAVVACLAGMASKEVMASAPLMVLLFDRTFVADSLRKALQRSWPLYASLASTWILLTVLSRNQPHAGSAGFGLMPLHSWWLTQTHIVWIYLKLAVWPSPLMIHYALPYLTTVADASLYVVPTLVLAIVALLQLWRNNPIGFLLICVFAILAPTSLVPIPNEMAAERRMYLPLAALAVLFVIGGFRAIQSLSEHWLSAGASFKSRLPQRAMVAAILAIVLACGLASAHRLTDFHDELKLWRQVSTLEPLDYVAHDTLGHLLLNSGQAPEAIEEFQSALALKPSHPDALNNLGHAFLVAERIPEAVDKFQAALALEPEFALAHNNLGVAFRILGRLPESIEQLEQARKLQPNFYPARINLGRSLLISHRLPDAVDELQAALALKPDDLPALTNLALAYSQMGQPTEAIATAEKAIELARGTGQQATAEQLEEWLTHYRTELGRAAGSKVPSQTTNRNN